MGLRTIPLAGARGRGLLQPESADACVARPKGADKKRLATSPVMLAQRAALFVCLHPRQPGFRFGERAATVAATPIMLVAASGPPQ
jgi:hypothetical protein